MRALFILALTFALTAYAADIYRWVDEDGNVHFSDTKPGEDKTTEVIAPDIRQPGVPDEGELRRREYLKSADLIDAEREAEERLARPELERQMTEGIRQRRADARCWDARVKFGVTLEGMPIYWTEDGDIRPDWVRDYYKGSRDYIADEDRESVRDKIIDDMHRYCEDPLNQDLQIAAYNEWIDQEYCRVEEIALQAALRPQTRTPDDEIEKIRARMAEYCR